MFLWKPQISKQFVKFCLTGGINSWCLTIGSISMVSSGNFLPLWYHSLWRMGKLWRAWVFSLVGVGSWFKGRPLIIWGGVVWIFAIVVFFYFLRLVFTYAPNKFFFFNLDHAPPPRWLMVDPLIQANSFMRAAILTPTFFSVLVPCIL